jgi:hypothetical protein
MKLYKIAILNNNFTGIERICELVKRMWIRMSEVEDYNVSGHCHIIHANQVIDEAMKYYFYKQKDDKLTVQQKLVQCINNLNPDFQLDYLQAKLSELGENSGLIVVHSVNNKTVAEALLSQGFKLMRFTPARSERIANVSLQQPTLDEDDIAEFLQDDVDDMEGTFYEIDTQKSTAVIVTNIVHFVLS